jgi:hypothetical protein
MFRSPTVLVLLLLAPLVTGCGGDDESNIPTAPTPIAVTETFSGTLTPNGGRTHEFTVQQAGTVTVKLSALSPDEMVLIGLSLGTWNGATCATATISNDKAGLNASVVGTAQQTGLFCARVYDAAGTLTASTDYSIEVTHF